MFKEFKNFIVFRAQKDGSADRSWFCELYDGEATAGVKASNDVKRITVEVGSYALSIGGFHQPQPFLMEHSDLKLRQHGFPGACGEHARGSFLYDHYIQVVIKRKKAITIVVKIGKRIS